jgi:hypothetical protein
MSYAATTLRQGLRSCLAYLIYQFTACPTFKRVWHWVRRRPNGGPYKPPSVHDIVAAQLRLVCSRRFVFVVGVLVGLALYDIELGRMYSWLEEQGLTARVEPRDFDAETGMPLQPVYKANLRFHI